MGGRAGRTRSEYHGADCDEQIGVVLLIDPWTADKRSLAARAMFDKHEAEQRAAMDRPPRGREAW
jgi:hypothetical protein